jgi:signal transduction histidine kinase
VGNAINYGDPLVPITIDVREQGPDVIVDVHNEGPAISEALQKELFSPFRRGDRDNRKTAETAGLGLGLYISREIVVAHGGDLDVRSSSTEGTTFRVKLPRLSGSSDQSEVRSAST